MATEDNHPSFYSVLYDAMTDHELIGDLLRHYEFRRKAGQICREIAGPEGGDELFRQACLRMREYASDLRPNTIRGEREFFRWFSRLARQVHLGNALSAAAVNRCIDGAGLWPDSSDDVPADDMERFLAHADECPYHTRILRAEEEELRAAFNRARGLDSHGRILLGDELKASVAEHRRRLQNWREAVSKKPTPFAEVALFNSGVKVASCGKFYDFPIHQSRNELDPYAGLHICGVSGDSPDESVLLGFYALAGVRHTGEEHRLALENGYTVGLRIKQLDETTFDIVFRCVETKKLEPKPVQPAQLPPGSPVPPVSGGWWPLPRSVYASALFALLLLVTIPVLLAVMRGGQVESGAESRAEAILTDASTNEANNAAPAPTPAEVRVSPTSVKATPPKKPKPTPPAQAPAGNKAGPKPGAANSRQSGTRPQIAKRNATPKTRRDAKTPLKAPTAHTARRTPENREQRNPMLRALRIIAPNSKSLPDIESLDRVYDRRPVIRLWLRDGRAASPHASMLHATKNADLGRKLDNALRKLQVNVASVGDSAPATEMLGINWDVNIYSPHEKWFVVTLNGHIFRGSENIFGQQPSYKGVGRSLKDAYDAAVKQVVKHTVAWIRGDGKAFSLADAGANGRASRPQPALTDADLTDEDGGPK